MEGLNSRLKNVRFPVAESFLGITTDIFLLKTVPTHNLNLQDPSLAPEGKHCLHAYFPATEPYELWKGLDRKR